MSRPDIYVCSACGDRFAADERHLKLVAKDVVFRTWELRRKAGRTRGKMLRRRCVAWLCFPCLEKDPDYNLRAQDGAPGMRHTKHARTNIGAANDPER